MNAKKVKRIRKSVGLKDDGIRFYDEGNNGERLNRGKRKDYRVRKKVIKVLNRRKSFKEKLDKNK